MPKRKKNKGNESSKKAKINERTYVSIKVPLQKILNDTESKQLIIDTISDYSIKATKISALVSLYLLKEVNEAYDRNDIAFFEQNVSKYIQECFRGCTLSGTLNDEFEALLIDIQKPDAVGWGNTFVYLYEQFETNWSTNINTHAASRLKKYFRTIDGITQKEIKDTANFLMNRNSKVNPNVQLLNSLANINIIPNDGDDTDDDEFGNSEDEFALDSDSDADQNDEQQAEQNINGFKRGFYRKRLKVSWFRQVPIFINIQRIIDDHNRQIGERPEQDRQANIEVRREQENDDKKKKKRNRKKKKKKKVYSLSFFYSF